MASLVLATVVGLAVGFVLGGVRFVFSGNIERG